MPFPSGVHAAFNPRLGRAQAHGRTARRDRSLRASIHLPFRPSVAQPLLIYSHCAQSGNSLRGAWHHAHLFSRVPVSGPAGGRRWPGSRSGAGGGMLGTTIFRADQVGGPELERRVLAVRSRMVLSQVWYASLSAFVEFATEQVERCARRCGEGSAACAAGTGRARLSQCNGCPIKLRLNLVFLRMDCWLGLLNGIDSGLRPPSS